MEKQSVNWHIFSSSSSDIPHLVIIIHESYFDHKVSDKTGARASENQAKSRNKLISGPTSSENGSKFPFFKFTFCPTDAAVEEYKTNMYHR